MSIEELRKKSLQSDYFAYIAVWQMLVFVFLICLIWIIEILNLPGIVFEDAPENMFLFRGFLLTAAVLGCAIVMIGNTFMQQKQILTGLLTVCSKCHKVKIDEKKWSSMQGYVEQKTLASLSHGLCPECRAILESEHS